MVGLLAVRHDFIELVSLNKTLDHLVGGSSLLEDLEGHLWVVLPDDITKLIGHCELSFLDPSFNELSLSSL